MDWKAIGTWDKTFTDNIEQAKDEIKGEVILMNEKIGYLLSDLLDEMKHRKEESDNALKQEKDSFEEGRNLAYTEIIEMLESRANIYDVDLRWKESNVLVVEKHCFRVMIFAMFGQLGKWPGTKRNPELKGGANEMSLREAIALSTVEKK